MCSHFFVYLSEIKMCDKKYKESATHFSQFLNKNPPPYKIAKVCNPFSLQQEWFAMVTVQTMQNWIIQNQRNWISEWYKFYKRFDINHICLVQKDYQIKSSYFGYFFDSLKNCYNSLLPVEVCTNSKQMLPVISYQSLHI